MLAAWIQKIWGRFRRPPQSSGIPGHLRRGQLGERAARDHLHQTGYKILRQNHREGHAEIDLICRKKDMLVFVEVRTRDVQSQQRPATTVTSKKQRLLSRAALAYLRRLGNPSVRFRFDIVEVWTQDDEVVRLCHLPDAFRLAKGHEYPR